MVWVLACLVLLICTAPKASAQEQSPRPGTVRVQGHAPSAPTPTLLRAASVTRSLPGSSRVSLHGALRVSGEVRAPAGGLIPVLDGVLGSVLDAVLQPLAGVAGHTVNLELRSPTGWSTYASSRTDAAGRYSLVVPTNAYGARSWRVASPATRTSAAAASTPFSVTVPPGYTPAGSSTAFRLLSGGRARWNPCRVVPYYVNRAGMPRGAAGVLSQALAKVSAATGLTFRYAGTSSAVPFKQGTQRRGLPDYGFTVAWSTPSKVRLLRGSTVGLSGSWSRSTTLSATPQFEYFSGGIVIDRTEHLRVRMGKGRTLGFVLMHELGHLVGLDHVAAPSQVMTRTMTRSSRTAFGAGDLAGFAAVGLGAGCVSA